MEQWAGYFDANATTPLRPVAREALIKGVDTQWANPGSPYRRATGVHRAIESARSTIAASLGLAPERILFLSGATEANNIVFASMRRIIGDRGTVWVSAVEHPSVLAPAAAHFGERLQHLAVSADGVIDPAELQRQLDRSDVALVSIMAANNETGVIQPWRKIAALCRAKGVPFHCDASQWIGKEPAEGIGECDFVSACAHKFGGPKGTGFLVTSERWGRISGLLGGGQENDQRAGTEDCPAIIAMAAALTEAVTEDNTERRQWAADFGSSLVEQLPGCSIVGANAARLWNSLMVIMPEFKQTRWVAALDRQGFQVSTGSACSTSSEGPSHVLLAMGMPAAAASRAIRISAGWWTTRDDWSRLLAACRAVPDKLR